MLYELLKSAWAIWIADICLRFIAIVHIFHYIFFSMVRTSERNRPLPHLLTRFSFYGKQGEVKSFTAAVSFTRFSLPKATPWILNRRLLFTPIKSPTHTFSLSPLTSCLKKLLPLHLPFATPRYSYLPSQKWQEPEEDLPGARVPDLDPWGNDLQEHLFPPSLIFFHLPHPPQPWLKPMNPHSPSPLLSITS